MVSGIIGSGNHGAASKSWASEVHQVLFSYSRDPEKLRTLSLFNEHTQSGMAAIAIDFGEVLTSRYPQVPTDVLAGCGTFWQ